MGLKCRAGQLALPAAFDRAECGGHEDKAALRFTGAPAVA